MRTNRQIMKKNITCFFYFGIVFFCACKKEAELAIPYTEPQLVLSAFICPQDSLLQVAVSLSNPLSSNPTSTAVYESMQTATVKIQEGTKTYDLLYDSKLERYVIDSFKLKISTGHTYFLSVTTADGKSAFASTTIPALNNTLNYSIVKNKNGKDNYFIEGTWVDTDPGYTDTYIFAVHYTSFSLITGTSTTAGNFTDTIRRWAGDGVVITDAEGQQFRKLLNFTYRASLHDTVIADLTVLSKEYIDYRNKLAKAAGAFSTPFSEPVQMYSNVTGGLGVFAGFSRDTRKIFP